MIAIDKINCEFKIIDTQTADSITQKPDDGCYISGMFLEGAKYKDFLILIRWDYKRHLLTQPKPKELFSPLPLIHIVPIEMTDDQEPEKKGVYNCPLYKVVSRVWNNL